MYRRIVNIDYSLRYMLVLLVHCCINEYIRAQLLTFMGIQYRKEARLYKQNPKHVGGLQSYLSKRWKIHDSQVKLVVRSRDTASKQKGEQGKGE